MKSESIRKLAESAVKQSFPRQSPIDPLLVRNVEQALMHVRAEALEEAAKYVEAQGCIHRMEGETTWAALAESYSAKLRKRK